MRLSRYFNVKIFRRRAVALLFLAGAACGGKSGAGPTPAADPPQIACPADVTRRDVTALTQDVTYPAATATGGVTPVSVTCTPPSGTTFGLGSTTVTCRARDAQGREAACTFRVTVSGFPLGAKKFVAMGDSLTEGENGRTSLVDTPNSYPSRLQLLLQASYPDQGITVVNRGVGRTTAEEMRDAVRGVVQADRPDGLLLMSGYNNLRDACAPGSATSAACGRATEAVEFAVRDAIRRAKEATPAVRFIFVSTLVPPGPTGPRRIAAAAIVEVNQKIKRQIALERGTLVDSYAAFIGHEAEYVSADGLHLNPAGYQAVAEAFFAAIRAAIPQTPG